MTGVQTEQALIVAEPATTRSHLWILFVIGGAQLMVVLDSTIVIIALPSIQRSLQFSNADRQWVVTAYTLGFGGLLLLGGRIGDLIGPRRTLIIGVVGFAAASAVGGSAHCWPRRCSPSSPLHSPTRVSAGGPSAPTSPSLSGVGRSGSYSAGS
jgi:MFS family permease